MVVLPTVSWSSCDSDVDEGRDERAIGYRRHDCLVVGVGPGRLGAGKRITARCRGSAAVSTGRRAPQPPDRRTPHTVLFAPGYPFQFSFEVMELVVGA
ncbi:MAG: hypothetical protein LC799_10470 [Actinobacteria bacterium]|nr:hypothetical protein [Actinomycetota bacterium]